jgi:phosphate uptake regulator
MGEHTVAAFDEDLGQISKLISDMGDLAGAMVGGATKALLTSDNALAQRVVSDDAIMDARQRELDDRAITLIAKRQPMAQDLRAVVAAVTGVAGGGDVDVVAQPVRVHGVTVGAQPHSRSRVECGRLIGG